MRILLFGDLRVVRDDLVLARFRTQKTAGLLAYLACDLHRSHRREALIELFWPDSDPEDGRNCLSVALSSLRRRLEPPGVPPGAVVLADRVRVQLNPAVVSTDAAEFEAALQAAESAEGEGPRVALLLEAVALYREPLLPAWHEAWLFPEQERLAGLFLDAVRRLTAHYEAVADLPRCLSLARRAVEVEPLREEAHYELIRLLAVSGERSAALRQFRRLEEILREELDAVPGPAARALSERLQAEEQRAGGRQEDRAPKEQGRRRSCGPLSPSGVRTLLLTDVPTGGTSGGIDLEPARGLVSGRRGQEVRDPEARFAAVFPQAVAALECALACRELLARAGVNPRMVLDAGDISLREGAPEGLAVRRAAGMLPAAHPGQLLCSESAAALVRPDLPLGARLIELGHYRLRGLARPERLFQVGPEDPSGARFPPLAAEPALATNLPSQVSRFFGRGEEIARLCEMLAPGRGCLAPDFAPRLVTLTGPGGSGKTRLALEVARRLAAPYAGQAWWIPLADLTDPRVIPAAVRDALLLPRTSDEDPFEQVLRALGVGDRETGAPAPEDPSAGHRPALLLLDNFEQLVEEGAAVVQALLERAPGLTLLVTSRRRLDLGAEREFPVRPLPLPASSDGENPERLVGNESAQLFIDRAQAVRPDFQATPSNAPSLAQLCIRLEGIPLALELAAARVRVLTVSRMVQQLDHRFELLASHRRDLPARHRTLRAAIDWSYRLLPPELQRLFLRLSVFRGGWSPQAAAFVAREGTQSGSVPDAQAAVESPDTDVLEGLAQLLDCSLVQALEPAADALSQEERETVPSPSPPCSDLPEIRFRMLETLREYAQELLSAEARAALRERHAAYFLELAGRAEPHLDPEARVDWLQCLEEEHDNIRAALEHYSAQECGGKDGLRLVTMLRKYWELRGHLSEGRAHLAALLSRADTALPTAERAGALATAGTLASYQCDHAAAGALYAEALAIWQSLGERSAVSQALRRLGNLAHRQGDYGGAGAYYGQSLATARELGDASLVASLLHDLGEVARCQGDFSAARPFYEESLALFQRQGNSVAGATVLGTLGLLAYRQGDYASGRSLYKQALAIQRQFGFGSGMAASLANLGIMALEEGDCPGATDLLRQSLAAYRELGDRRGAADCLIALAKTACGQGDFQAARCLHAESEAAARELGDRRLEAYALAVGGVLALEEGDGERAQALHAESLRLRRDLGDRRGVAECLQHLGSAALTRGSPERAARLFGAAEAMREALEMPLPPNAQADYAREVARLRAGMGAEAASAAWTGGRDLAVGGGPGDAVLGRVVAFALGDTDDVPPPSLPRPPAGPETRLVA